MEIVRGKNTKAQSALEFLTTYGWAFLVILIMIGSLAYFGILDPSIVLPNRCNFGAEFECRDAIISAEGQRVLLQIQNNVGAAINITNITVEVDVDEPLPCLFNSGPQMTGPPLEQSTKTNRSRNGGVVNFDWWQCDFDTVGFQSGSKEKLLIGIRYFKVKSGDQFIHEVNGDLFSTVI